MSKEIFIQDSMPVWVAWTNTDCTEGKGRQVPYAVCSSEATARRLGKGKSVMGSDCDVRQSIAVKINNQWLAPAQIAFPTKGDEATQKRLDKQAELIEKALAAGLTKEDIAALRSPT